MSTSVRDGSARRSLTVDSMPRRYGLRFRSPMKLVRSAVSCRAPGEKNGTVSEPHDLGVTQMRKAPRPPALAPSGTGNDRDLATPRRARPLAGFQPATGP